ncbi:hypothetical protein BKA82DRAFT_4128613 [Pisolithus tinctorius]|nr:hypothetical protein BKA82DRAFT_4128613 [Pisolithus tinctorius]
MGVLMGLTTLKYILEPFSQVSASVFIATVVFLYFLPLLYDSILLTCLFALYPLGSMPPTTLVKIFALPFCIKCARVAIITIAVLDYVWSGIMTNTLTQNNESSAWFHDPYMIAKWTMQIIDNLYSISFFLYNLHVHTLLINRGEHTTMHLCGVLLLINSYVTVMGVMCVTLWSSGSEWDHVSGGKTRSSIVLVGEGSLTHGTADLDTGMNLNQLSTSEKVNKHTFI